MTKGRGYWFCCFVVAISLAEIIAGPAGAVDELATSRYFGNGDLKARSIRRAGSEYRPDPNPLRYSYSSWNPQDHPIPARSASWVNPVKPASKATNPSIAGPARTETARVLPCAPAAVLVLEGMPASRKESGNLARIVTGGNGSLAWSSIATVPSKVWTFSANLGDQYAGWLSQSQSRTAKNPSDPAALMTARYNARSEALELPANRALGLLADGPARRPAGPGNMVYSRFEVADGGIAMSSRIRRSASQRGLVQSMGAATSRSGAPDSSPDVSAPQRKGMVPAKLAGWKIPARSRTSMLQGFRPADFLEHSRNYASTTIARIIDQAARSGQSFAQAFRIWPFARTTYPQLDCFPTEPDLDRCLEYYSTAQHKTSSSGLMVPGIKNGIRVSRQVFQNVARVIAPVILLAESIFHAERDVVNWIQSRFPHSPWAWSNLGGSLGGGLRF